MSMDRVYKQAIKRVFTEKCHGDRMAVYWRSDDTINVIASQRHYVHKIARQNEDICLTPSHLLDPFVAPTWDFKRAR